MIFENGNHDHWCEIIEYRWIIYEIALKINDIKWKHTNIKQRPIRNKNSSKKRSERLKVVDPSRRYVFYYVQPARKCISHTICQLLPLLTRKIVKICGVWMRFEWTPKKLCLLARRNRASHHISWRTNETLMKCNEISMTSQWKQLRHHWNRWNSITQLR